MKHLLDYDILQEWGFVWATKHDFGNGEVVTSYIKQDTSVTDAHGFCPISLTLYPHDNFGSYWVMQYLEAKWITDTLFAGRITSKSSLKCILKSCVVFK